MDRPKIIVAIDIEKAGPMLFQHPIISIGTCIGDINGNVLQKWKLNLEVNWPSEEDLGSFDKDCWEKFWTKQPQTLIESLQIDSHTQKFGFQKFSTWLDGIEREFPEEKFNVKFVSDNPAFDIGNIDANLEKYCERKSMMYSSSGNYRSITNPCDMLKMVPKNSLKEMMEKIPARHTHDPADDAEYIYHQYVLADLIRSNIEHRLSYEAGAIQK